VYVYMYTYIPVYMGHDSHHMGHDSVYMGRDSMYEGRDSSGDEWATRVAI